MNLICPRCQITNVSEALFCKNCGTGFNVKPIRNNLISTPVIIIIAVVAICGFCGLFGLLNGNRKNEVTKPVDSSLSSTPSSTFSENSSSLSARSLVETANAATTEKTKGSKSATVKSENANLRETANSSGAVIQTLAENAEIEVIRQQGAWFYVSAGGRSDCLHGNTIRLAAAPKKSESSATVADNFSASTHSPKSRTKSSGGTEGENNDTDVTSDSA